MSPEPNIESTVVDRAALRDIILRALAVRYTSRSCKDDIATGNHYQTISLDGRHLPGFRGSREAVLDALDFDGRTVLDIGSNLGEVARGTAYRGASLVHGIEYDPFFVLLSELTTLYNRVPIGTVTFEQADVTREFKFNQSYDVVLAFSVFTYISHRIREIADATKKVLVIETHNIVDDSNLDSYTRLLRPHFQIVVNIGDSDWGLSREYAEGRRAILLCFRSASEFWSFNLRCQERQPCLSSLKEIDIGGSNVPALREFLGSKITADTLASIPEGNPIATALNIPYPTSQSHLAYWLEFWRGSLCAKRRGDITPDNPYIRLMRDMVSRNLLFDPGAMAPMKDEAVLMSRCADRLRLVASGAINPILLFDYDSKPQKFLVRTTSGEDLTCTSCDGYHRLAAASINGKGTLAAYHFRVQTQSAD